jgi:hypothetical protein
VIELVIVLEPEELKKRVVYLSNGTAITPPEPESGPSPEAPVEPLKVEPEPVKVGEIPPQPITQPASPEEAVADENRHQYKTSVVTKLEIDVVPEPEIPHQDQSIELKVVDFTLNPKPRPEPKVTGRRPWHLAPDPHIIPPDQEKYLRDLLLFARPPKVIKPADCPIGGCRLYWCRRRCMVLCCYPQSYSLNRGIEEEVYLCQEKCFDSTCRFHYDFKKVNE